MSQNNSSELYNELLMKLVKSLSSSSLSPMIDKTLNVEVPDKFLARLRSLKNNIDTIDISLEGLKDFHFELSKIAAKTEELILEASNYLVSSGTEKKGYYMSESQSLFVNELMGIICTVCNYQLVATDLNGLSDIYGKLMSLHRLLEDQPDNIEAFIKTHKKSGTSFKEKILKYANQEAQVPVGFESQVEKIESTILRRRNIENKMTFIILYGPPGSGKSTIVHYISKIYNDGTFDNLGPSQLSVPEVGLTEQELVNYFKELETNSRKKFMFVLDECDTIFSPNARDHFKTVAVTFQTEIEGSRTKSLQGNVIIIAITNYLKQIPDTIRRRAAYELLVDYPQKEILLDIFVSNLDIHLIHNNVLTEVKTLLDRAYVSPANVIAWVNLAKDLAYHEIRMKFKNDSTEEYLCCEYEGKIIQITDNVTQIPEGTFIGPVNEDILSKLCLRPTIGMFKESFKKLAVIKSKEQYEAYCSN